MIAFLNGKVAEKSECSAVIEVAGIGYSVSMSTSSLAALPAEGDEVMVYTHMHVREDEMSLFGFESVREKTLFGKLITVSGVGPKVALAALSSYPPDTLIEGIVREDVALVSSVPGIGKKTAQRIILDLKDKLDAPYLGTTSSDATADSAIEAREALLAMGFSSAEIASALKGYAGASDDSKALLTYALKRLGGGV